MELYAIQILYKKGPDTNILKTIYNLGEFPSRHQAHAQSFWEFVTQYIIGRIVTNSMIQITLSKDYEFFALMRRDGLTVALITGSEYPSILAQQLLFKIVIDFVALIPRLIWTFPGPLQVLYSSLQYFLQKYHHPTPAIVQQATRSYSPIPLEIYTTMENLLGDGFGLEKLRAIHYREFGNLPFHLESPTPETSSCTLL
jgi:hypothetical protein